MDSSVYDDFDVLNKNEMLEQVYNLQVNSLMCYMFADEMMRHYEREKKKGKIREYKTVIKRSLAQFHLCELFLKTKNDHDMQHAIMELEALDDQRKAMDEKDEFEASAKIRDKQNEIRNYLTKKNKANERAITG